MYWNDEEETNSITSPDDKIDFVFQLVGKTLPQSYLFGFAHALQNQIQWWDDQDDISFHIVIAGEEGNGWFRGNNPEDPIYISKRNMLVVRAPRHLAEKIESLKDTGLDVLQHAVILKHKHNKEIKPAPTLYSRYVVCDDKDESSMVEEVVIQLQKLDIKCKKILCGKERSLNINNKEIITRSLMLEDLGKEDSIVIQSNGLGAFQKIGCGVFIPHKSVK